MRKRSLILIILTVFTTGCYYDQVLPKIDYEIEHQDSISFSEKIQPIFTDKCITCHPPTSSLDLRQGEAFNSINKPKYIDSTTPSASLIYTKPLHTGSHGGKYNSNEEGTLLKWLEEGAQDN